MIVDSSAIIAIVRHEPPAERLLRIIAKAPSVRISAAVWFETTMVLCSPRVGHSRADLDELARRLRIGQIAFTEEHAVAALDAWQRFGKGHHPAGLNFGDCMSYATAKLAGEPLLYIGDDFTQTDIGSALQSLG